MFYPPIKSKAPWLIIWCLSSSIPLSENPLMVFHYLPTNGIGPLSFSFQMRKLGIRRVRWLPIGSQLVWDGPGVRFQMCPTPTPGLLWRGIWAASWRWGLTCVELDIVGEGRLGWRIMSWSSEMREHLAGPEKRDPWMQSLESWCFLDLFAKGGPGSFNSALSFWPGILQHALPYLGPASRTWEPAIGVYPLTLWQTPFLHPVAASLLFRGLYTHTVLLLPSSRNRGIFGTVLTLRFYFKGTARYTSYTVFTVSYYVFHGYEREHLMETQVLKSPPLMKLFFFFSPHTVKF